MPRSAGFLAEPRSPCNNRLLVALRKWYTPERVALDACFAVSMGGELCPSTLYSPFSQRTTLWTPCGVIRPAS
jgi:hypothetical protein